MSHLSYLEKLLDGVGTECKALGDLVLTNPHEILVLTE